MGIGASTNRWDGSIMPSQKGKLAIVTGANCGIGFEAAKALALRGAHVVLACRDESRGRRALETIRRALNAEGSDDVGGGVELMLLDLAEVASIREFARVFRAKYDHLDLLINNAVVACPPQRAQLERLGVHVRHQPPGPLLPDKLAVGSAASVEGPGAGGERLERIAPCCQVGLRHVGAHPGNSMSDYAESKMANVLFTYELQRRLQAAGVDNVLSVVVHPGLSTRRSGTTTVESVHGGEIYAPDGWMTLRGYPVLDTSHPASHSLDNADKLWKLSEDLLDAKFEV
ncbi:WW domain-containing oxidoreductase [Phytophthora cinnamomi]|uniref:WW domain-containing oxidoreductase n=1 Tax=Phytophthora cinnamomi TaxID=4785 RepID=UPI0035597E51|nr:WW domain-containing oxidoreductase [Phytophthora cinnamomi]